MGVGVDGVKKWKIQWVWRHFPIQDFNSATHYLFAFSIWDINRQGILPFSKKENFQRKVSFQNTQVGGRECKIQKAEGNGKQSSRREFWRERKKQNIK